MAVDRRAAQAANNTGFVGLALAVFVGAGIGGAVLFYIHGTMKKTKTPVLAVSASASTSAAPPAVAPPPLLPDASVPADDISVEEDLDAAAPPIVDASDDAAPTVVHRRPRAAPPKASASSGPAPPDLPPNPFE